MAWLLWMPTLGWLAATLVNARRQHAVERHWERMLTELNGQR